MTHSTYSIQTMSGDFARLPLSHRTQPRAVAQISSFRSGAIIGAANPMEPPPAPYGRNEHGKSQLSPHYVRNAAGN